MHALMTAVLLRLTGLDALDGDTQSQPPDRELRQIEETIGAGKGDTIVGADGLGQTALLEQLFEGCKCRVFTHRLQGLAQQQEARGMVADGERIAIVPVAKSELTFEVGAP